MIAFFSSIGLGMVGTALLIEAAGKQPNRTIGLNGVFGNAGVALAPMVTAFLVFRWDLHAAFAVPSALRVLAGISWLRVPNLDQATRRNAKPFPEIPWRQVRRDVIVLLLIAAVSGRIFNAFTLLPPKLMQERLADSPGLLPLAGVAATVATLCGAVTQLTVGRTTLKRLLLPMALLLAPALAAFAVVTLSACLPSETERRS